MNNKEWNNECQEGENQKIPAILHLSPNHCQAPISERRVSHKDHEEHKEKVISREGRKAREDESFKKKLTR